MLASFPASMVNQKSTDLGIPNRFKLKSSRFSGLSRLTSAIAAYSLLVLWAAHRRERIAGTPHSAAKRIGAIKKNLKDGDLDIRAPYQQT